MIFGIQGGQGSFNEQAILTHFSRKGEDFSCHRIVYLYITERVLQGLLDRRIDQGQFGVRNSIGGVVSESAEAKAKFDFDRHFQIIDEYELPISHCLMIHPEASLSDVDTIMTHQQVIAQCRSNLDARFPAIHAIEGEGDFLDPARVGQAIASGELAKNIATLSCSRIADIYGLKVVATDLQDREDNVTTFVLVRLKDSV